MAQKPQVDSEYPDSPSHLSTDTHDLEPAESFTIIIHRVGATDSETMLSEAAQGYIASGLGETFEHLVFSECPTLSRKKGVAAIALNGSRGRHLLVALPWADRRVRLSFVAKFYAIALLVLTAMVTIAFFFRNPLDSITEWLRPTRHHLLAQGVLIVLGFMRFAIRSNPKEEFKPLSGLILLWPALLLLGLLIFVSSAQWLWLLMGVLIVALWIVATIIVLRCVPLAPSSRWRATLVMLIVAMAFPGVSAVRSAWHLTRAIETRHNDDFGSFPTSNYVFDAAEQKTPSDDLFGIKPEAQAGLGSNLRSGDLIDSHKKEPTRKKNPVNEKERPVPSVPSKFEEHQFAALKSLDSLYQSGAGDAFARASSTPDLGKNIDPARLKELDAILSAKPKEPKLTELITASDFLQGLSFAAICMAGCVIAIIFNWPLDLGLDVLNYGGNKKTRTSLIQGTIDAIRWLHDQAPSASIIVVGHSLGSIIASHAVNSIPSSESVLDQTTLVTLGSPLNYLWRLFLQEVEAPRKLSAGICRRARWINLWRSADPIGKALETEPGSCVQYCVGNGGHVRYWADGAVWRAVAYESLRVGIRQLTPSVHDDSARCLLEKRLWPLTLLIISIVLCCGAALWGVSTW